MSNLWDGHIISPEIADLAVKDPKFADFLILTVGPILKKHYKEQSDDKA